MILKVLFLSLFILSNAIDITTSRIDRGEITIEAATYHIFPDVFWSIIDNPISNFPSSFTNEGEFFVTSTDAIPGLHIRMTGTQFINNGIVSFNSIQSTEGPEYYLNPYIFQNDGELYFGGPGSDTSVMTILGTGWVNRGLIVFSSSQRTNAPVNLGDVSPNGPSGGIGNSGTICFRNQFFHQGTGVSGPGCMDIGTSSTVYVDWHGRGAEHQFSTSQILYMSTTSSSILVAANMQTLTVVGFGNHNIIGHTKQIMTHSYDGNILSLYSGPMAYERVDYIIGPGYFEELFRIISDDFDGLLSNVINNAIWYDGTTPQSGGHPSCLVCKQAPPLPQLAVSSSESSTSSIESSASSSESSSSESSSSEVTSSIDSSSSTEFSSTEVSSSVVASSSIESSSSEVPSSSDSASSSSSSSSTSSVSESASSSSVSIVSSVASSIEDSSIISSSSSSSLESSTDDSSTTDAAFSSSLSASSVSDLSSTTDSNSQILGQSSTVDLSSSVSSSPSSSTVDGSASTKDEVIATKSSADEITIKSSTVTETAHCPVCSSYEITKVTIVEGSTVTVPCEVEVTTNTKGETVTYTYTKGDCEACKGYDTTIVTEIEGTTTTIHCEVKITTNAIGDTVTYTRTSEQETDKTEVAINKSAEKTASSEKTASPEKTTSPAVSPLQVTNSQTVAAGAFTLSTFEGLATSIQLSPGLLAILLWYIL